jgi:hypothetical protein
MRTTSRNNDEIVKRAVRGGLECAGQAPCARDLVPQRRAQSVEQQARPVFARAGVVVAV